VRSDNRLAIIIFVVLVVVLVGVPVVTHQVREAMAPRLLEVRIITATDRDPVFRDGPRHVPAASRVQIAAALRVGRAGRSGRWMAPVRTLELGGTPIQHIQSDVWPDRNRAVRVFWFTVESSNVGGDLTTANAGQRLRYRTFLASEMGRSLRAAAYPQAHNEDQFEGIVAPPPGSGTIRLYARAEVYDPDRESVPLEAATTAAAEHALDPDYPAVYRSVHIAGGIDDVVGELFNLPGFEPEAAAGASPNDVTVPAFGLTFTDMVQRRLVTSSGTFAAVAATGAPTLEPGGLTRLGAVRMSAGVLRGPGRPLRWGTDVKPGDLLHGAGLWLVLVADDGNGVLDIGDTATWCWRSPPTVGTLRDGLPAEGAFQLARHVS